MKNDEDKSVLFVHLSKKLWDHLRFHTHDLRVHDMLVNGDIKSFHERAIGSGKSVSVLIDRNALDEWVAILRDHKTILSTLRNACVRAEDEATRGLVSDFNADPKEGEE